MPAIVALLSLVLAPADLASDSWLVRDAAERRLRRAGIFAVPLLRPLATSDDTEVRRVAGRLVATSDAFWGDVATAHAWLIDDRFRLDGVSATDAVATVYRDPNARYRLARAFARFGVLETDESHALTNGTAPDAVLLWFGVADYSTAYALIRRAQDRWRGAGPTDTGEPK